MSWIKDLDKYVVRSSPSLAGDSSLQGADLGRRLGFSRIAVHHVVLPPGTKSSLPHAESHEEEFVFVLQGHPDVWIDGYLSRLHPGHAAGFPAGTGLAHTFINNSQSNVLLLVAGEMTLGHNKYFYPLSENLKNTKEHGEVWWHNPPKRPLGPHDGEPGVAGQDCYADVLPSCIVDTRGLPLETPFAYPGDSETFGEGQRLTDLLGLKVLGISHDVLLPGKRSAFGHAHTHEDECVQILSGKANLWLDGYSRFVSAGDFVGFPANTGLAHCLRNDEEETMTYLCVGETQEFTDEKIIYPHNPLRNRECRRKNWHWTAWKRDLGPLSDLQKLPFPDHLKLELVSSGEDICAHFPEETRDTFIGFGKSTKVPSLKDEEECLYIVYNAKIIGVVQIELVLNRQAKRTASMRLFVKPTEIQMNHSIEAFISDYIARAHEAELI